MVEPRELTGRILWAVDAFETSWSLLERAAEALCAVSGAFGARITPVYVGPESWLVRRHQLSRRMAEAEALLTERMGKVACPVIEPPCVLHCPTLGGAGRRVTALLQHAHRRSATLIATATRGREGPARWFGVSFAETLLQRASIPLLVVGPRVRPVADLATILYATDPSCATEGELQRLLSFARGAGARVIVCHVVAPDEIFIRRAGPRPERDADPVSAARAGGGGRYGQSPLSEKRSRLGEWARRAAEAGVELTVETRIVRRPGAAEVAIALHETARDRNAALLMLADESASPGVSGIARRLVRSADLPVWVLRGAGAADSALRRAG